MSPSHNTKTKVITAGSKRESRHTFPTLHTLAGPTPTNISRNSEPLTVMKGTLASPAVALAKSVFPVPGGPVKIAPYQ